MVETGCADAAGERRWVGRDAGCVDRVDRRNRAGSGRHLRSRADLTGRRGVARRRLRTEKRLRVVELYLLAVDPAADESFLIMRGRVVVVVPGTVHDAVLTVVNDR